MKSFSFIHYQAKVERSGNYWIDPNGGSTDNSFQAFYDMEAESGGWTLVATKVSPNFVFVKPVFSTFCVLSFCRVGASRSNSSLPLL